MDNLKLMNPANLDHYQMDNATFDVNKGAWRMTLVDGSIGTSSGSVQVVNIPEIIKQSEIHQINVPVIVKEPEIHQINVPVIVKEIQIERIEVPVIVKETVYVDKIVLVPEIKIVEIEKIVYKNLEAPLMAKICMVIQAAAVVGILLTNIFLKGR